MARVFLSINTDGFILWVDFRTDDTQVQGDDQDVRVDSLIGMHKRWDESQVHQCATTNDADCILRILDKLIWPYTNEVVQSSRCIIG